jgi:exopolysaccharide production protein ExoQ
MDLRVSRKKLKAAFEQGFVILGLLLFSRAFVPFFETESGSPGTVLQLAYLGVYGIITLFIIAHLRRFAWTATRDKLLLLVIAYVLLSVLWSSAPQVTLRRSVVFLGATGFGFYLATRFSLRQQVRLLAWMLGISAILSVLLALAMPHLGIGTGVHAGDWQGIYGQKNALGRLMAMAAMLFWLALSDPRRNKWVTWSLILLSAALVWLSASATSVVILLGIVFLAPFYRILRQRNTQVIPPLVIGGILLATLIVAVILINAEPLLAYAGKNITLSSRLPLWRDVLQEIGQRPWLGYGYNGFWTGAEGEAADIWNSFGWHPDHAHNGYLDMALDLGVIGLGLVLLHILSSFRGATALLWRTKTAEGGWPLAYLTFLALASLTYSILLSQYVFFWLLYVSTTLSMRIQLDRLRAMEKTRKAELQKQHSFEQAAVAQTS